MNSKSLLFISTILITLTGCNQNMTPTTLGQELKNQKLSAEQQLNTIPETFEVPDIESADVDDSKQGTKPTEDLPAETAVTEKTETSTQKSEPLKPSKFIETTFNVMVKEGKSIGTACNRYLQRVLVRAGFKVGDFVANDFDIYAKTHFKSYKSEDFKIDSTRSDSAELKKYLWSYPERTPFILQWTRPGKYGHVAIIERTGSQLVIYQASKDNYTAKRDKTTTESLLKSKNRAHLTVYSEFK